MSVSHRMYYTLLNNDLLLEFVQWVRNEYPIMFRNLIDQFIANQASATRP